MKFKTKQKLNHIWSHFAKNKKNLNSQNNLVKN